MYVVVYEAVCGGVIGLDGSWWLRMVESLKEDSDGYCDLGVMKYSTNLCLCCGGNYMP